MESSAVVYCNSVIGARTNTEGRESTSAAMLTGKIPDWGFHRDEYRHGTHLIEVEVPVESVMDWGMLGYFIGDAVRGKHPRFDAARSRQPDLHPPQTFRRGRGVVGRRRDVSHRRRYARSADARSWRSASTKPLATITYGADERRRVYESLNSNGRDPQRRLRDARLPARIDRTDRRGRAAAGRARRSATDAACGCSPRAR